MVEEAVVAAPAVAPPAAAHQAARLVSALRVPMPVDVPDLEQAHSRAPTPVEAATIPAVPVLRINLVQGRQAA